jgi:hypothetical protein
MMPPTSSLSVILTLNPSLTVILSEAKNLAALGTGSMKGKNLASLRPVLSEVKG